jgi:hypothetical protein
MIWIRSDANQPRREMNGGADANEGINLKQRWDQLRPRIIRPLGKCTAEVMASVCADNSHG